MSEVLRMQSYGGSDIGRRRTTNEDAYLCDDELGLWVVADGMGGHAAGEVASQEAIDTVHGMVKRGKTSLNLDGPLTDERSRAAARLLEGAVQAATYIVYAMAEIDRGKAGMGTTITAMMRFGTALVTAQVGDSRIYRVRDDDAVQLTEDHTLINWQLKHRASSRPRKLASASSATSSRAQWAAVTMSKSTRPFPSQSSGMPF
jgi:serine/threonine protein phosphatase PrpC